MINLTTMVRKSSICYWKYFSVIELMEHANSYRITKNRDNLPIIIAGID